MRSRDYAAAVQMWALGSSVGDIASVLGVTEHAVYCAIRQNRADFPYRNHHADWWRERLRSVEGMPRKAAAARLGVSAESVYQWMRRLDVR